MNKDDYTGIGILLLIIVIALLGGTKNNFAGPVDNTPKTEAEQRVDIEKQLKEAEKKALDIQRQIDEEEAKKTESKYKGLVFIRYVSRSTKPGNEYMSIQTDSRATTSIPITGWTIRSASSGNSVTIPKASYLFFAGQVNSEENIILSGGETVYIVTGISPNGASFKVNKCSGYLSQFQTFVPYLNTNCPRPRDMDLSSIPKLTINDACFDYLETFPACRIETKTLPLNWSYECKNFIYEKINYNSCINISKNDHDFYKKEWRVYLKRSDILWKQRRENIVLYDNEGKIVHSLTY